jgi:hypothetical protein
MKICILYQYLTVRYHALCYAYIYYIYIHYLNVCRIGGLTASDGKRDQIINEAELKLEEVQKLILVGATISTLPFCVILTM